MEKSKKFYKAFHVLGSYTNPIILAETLNKQLNFLYECGWEVDQINFVHDQPDVMGYVIIATHVTEENNDSGGIS